MAKFIVIQSRQVSKELHCFVYCFVKQRAACIINVGVIGKSCPVIKSIKTVYNTKSRLKESRLAVFRFLCIVRYQNKPQRVFNLSSCTFRLLCLLLTNWLLILKDLVCPTVPGRKKHRVNVTEVR